MKVDKTKEDRQRVRHKKKVCATKKKCACARYSCVRVSVRYVFARLCVCVWCLRVGRRIQPLVNRHTFRKKQSNLHNLIFHFLLSIINPLPPSQHTHTHTCIYIGEKEARAPQIPEQFVRHWGHYLLCACVHFTSNRSSTLLVISARPKRATPPEPMKRKS